MGVRIEKSIGYWLAKETQKEILKPDFSEILEEWVEKPLSSIMADVEKQALSFYGKDSLELVLFSLEMDLWRQHQTSPWNLIKAPFENDTGLLCSSIEQAKSRRYDDLIDFHMENQSLSNRVDFLNSPIYPQNGLIYKGGLFTAEFNLKTGSLLKPGTALHAQCMQEIKKYPAKSLADFFDFEINPFVYLLVRSTGILKENVDLAIFTSAVRPAIITSWT